MKFTSILGLLILLPYVSVSSYKILLMCPFPAPSHWLWIEHFARELVNRGHQVTAVTNFRTKQPHPNYTEILIDPSFDIPAYFPKSHIFEMKFSNDFQNLFMWWDVGVLTSEYALNDPKVKDLIKKKDAKYDLFILEQFFHESFLMFAHKLQTPIVTLGTFGYADTMDRAMGILTPWSFVPHIVLSYTDEMSFKQRAYNTLLSLFDLVLRKIYYIPKMQKMAEKHFKNAIEGPLPAISDLEKNISMMFINSHLSIDRPRPKMPGLVSVGGIHIKPVKPLPNDIQTFLNEAKNGAVYFSLGSYMKSIEMPREKIQIILDTFKKLKQRVLWKFEDESIQKNLPSNIMIKKWLPQSDILAHKNLRLFITHGGLFGTQEGLYRGVPMLFMPLYGDQHRNSIKSVREGYALSVNFANLTVEDFYTKITTILNDNKYAKRVKEASVLFRDNPLKPMDEAMFWIEYVIRHNGARHLKSAAVNLEWYEYVLLDVFIVYAAILLIGLYFLYTILKIVAGFVMSRNSKNDKLKTK